MLIVTVCTAAFSVGLNDDDDDVITFTTYSQFTHYCLKCGVLSGDLLLTAVLCIIFTLMLLSVYLNNYRFQKVSELSAKAISKLLVCRLSFHSFTHDKFIEDIYIYIYTHTHTHTHT